MCVFTLVLLVPLIAIAVFAFRLGLLMRPKVPVRARPWAGEERDMNLALARAMGRSVAIAKTNPPAK